MVRLHIKNGDDDLCLFEAPSNTPITDLTHQIAKIYNGRLKITRMAAEMENLADHGIHLPPNMVGLLSEQLEELKLKDSFATVHTPTGGYDIRPDDFFRRNGQAPLPDMTQLLKRAASEAKEKIHRNLVAQGRLLTYETVKDEFMKLKGAVTIVYPMGLPLHDPLHLELTSMETYNLDAGHGGYRNVIEPDKATLWWAGKELKGHDKILRDFVGPNEKTKVVIKLTEKGKGAPGREPIFTDEQKKAMMLHAHRRREELNKLDDDEDNNYLNSQWADNNALKRCFQGIDNIKFRPL